MSCSVREVTLAGQDDQKVAARMLHWFKECEAPDTALTKRIWAVLGQTEPFLDILEEKVSFKVDETTLCQMADAASRNFQLLGK